MTNNMSRLYKTMYLEAFHPHFKIIDLLHNMCILELTHIYQDFSKVISNIPIPLCFKYVVLIILDIIEKND